MKDAIKITIGASALMSAYVVAISFYKPAPITKGFITNMWVDSARHDVRLRSPGVWEEAWLPATCWMEIKDVSRRKYRRIEVHHSMMKTHHVGDWIELGDSTEFARKKAEAEQRAALLKRTGQDTAYWKAQERKLKLYNK